MTKDWETDEDRMRYDLLVHKNLIGWVIKELDKAGIPSKRTKGNDPNGDILLINPEDDPRVKEIINNIQKRFNR
ncbi:hypothetical protein ACE1CI_30900 [Aerosakkonemataceae cyanobacterium BLCC-F50]|uniref:Uncharacterized protein n=1 Tax=Floridaenema flaviceps BLCC-F50 TaxID=3153642 RepID=A0ABV4Y1M8_9CYAN